MKRLLLAVLVLSGCGGASNLSPEPPLRLLAVGNRWTFNGTQVGPDGTTAFTDTVEVANQDLSGKLHPAFLHTIQSSGQPDRTAADIFSQDSVTHDLRLIGVVRPDGTKASLNGSPLIPAQMQLGTTWTVKYANDDSNYVVCTIVDRDEVDVPSGRFAAWKMHAEIHTGTMGSYDSWFVPELGYFVKVIQTLGEGSDQVVVTEVLRNTNIRTG